MTMHVPPVGHRDCSISPISSPSISPARCRSQYRRQSVQAPSRSPYPGQALSRDTILERVWGYEFGGGTRTVDVHIRWLREKIEDDPSSPTLLQTVRGVGYKFVA